MSLSLKVWPYVVLVLFIEGQVLVLILVLDSQVLVLVLGVQNLLTPLQTLVIRDVVVHWQVGRRLRTSAIVICSIHFSKPTFETAVDAFSVD